MRKTVTCALAVALMAVGCKTAGDGSNVKADEPVGGAPTQPAPNADDLGLWREVKPLVKKIVVAEGEAAITEEWRGPGGYEYWLYKSSGNTGYLSNGDTYRPYQGSCSDTDELCKKVPAELARRCMHQAGETLKAIMDDPPPEWADYLTRNTEPNFYGWIDDGATMGFTGNMHKGPFRWNSYMKWAGSVLPDGTCTTPSLGQFIDQITKFDASGVFKIQN